MTDDAKHNIEQLETDLWAAADNLRAQLKLTSSEYCMPVLGVIFLRHATNRYDELLKLLKGANLGTAIVKAMDAIERDFEPLQGQLPKDYDKFENDLLENLLRVFDSETLRTACGDGL